MNQVGNHLSSLTITGEILRSTRKPAERTTPLSVLAENDFPIWPCFGCGLPCPRCYQRGGGLLPRLFTLIRQLPDGIFSAALSVITELLLQPPGVTRHPVLW